MLRAVAVLLIAATQPAVDAVRLQQQLIIAGSSRDVARLEAAIETARTAADALPLGDPRNRLRQSIIIATDLRRILACDSLYWDEEALPDYYDRLAGAYPEFGTFIAQFRIVDERGRVLFPSQETRAFLRDRLKSVPPARSQPVRKRRT